MCIRYGVLVKRVLTAPREEEEEDEVTYKVTFNNHWFHNNEPTFDRHLFFARADLRHVRTHVHTHMRTTA